MWIGIHESSGYLLATPRIAVWVFVPENKIAVIVLSFSLIFVTNSVFSVSNVSKRRAVSYLHKNVTAKITNKLYIACGGAVVQR